MGKNSTEAERGHTKMGKSFQQNNYLGPSRNFLISHHQKIFLREQDSFKGTMVLQVQFGPTTTENIIMAYLYKSLHCVPKNM